MKINPDAAGLDAARLERIDEHLQTRYIEQHKIAGCQVAVMRHGQLAHFRSLGLRDRERGKPVEDDTIWRLYSMTKPITGVALLSLYERGLFQLSDPIHRFHARVHEHEGEGAPRGRKRTNSSTRNVRSRSATR